MYANKTLDGYVKAIGLWADRFKKERAKAVERERIPLQSTSVALVLKTSRTTLTPEQRVAYDAGDIGAVPREMFRMVRVGVQAHVDRSRFSGEKLRQIRKSGGAGETARRLRQAGVVMTRYVGSNENLVSEAALAS